MGIHLFVNGAITSKDKQPRYLIDNNYQRQTAESSKTKLTVGCNVYKSTQSFGNFYLSMLAFSPMFSSIDELMKFSLPLKILPSYDWFLMMIHNGTTMTTPPLQVNGGVRQTNNGLLLDGKTGWLSTNALTGF